MKNSDINTNGGDIYSMYSDYNKKKLFIDQTARDKAEKWNLEEQQANYAAEKEYKDKQQQKKRENTQFLNTQLDKSKHEPVVIRRKSTDAQRFDNSYKNTAQLPQISTISKQVFGQYKTKIEKEQNIKTLRQISNTIAQRYQYQKGNQENYQNLNKLINNKIKTLEQKAIQKSKLPQITKNKPQENENKWNFDTKFGNNHNKVNKKTVLQVLSTYGYQKDNNRKLVELNTNNKKVNQAILPQNQNPNQHNPNLVYLNIKNKEEEEAKTSRFKVGHVLQSKIFGQPSNHKEEEKNI